MELQRLAIEEGFLTKWIFILWAQASFAAEVDILRCAVEIQQIMSEDSEFDLQSGMVFTDGNIIRNHGPSTPVLMILNERGTYLVPIQYGQVNRIALRLPDPDPRKIDRTLFVSFLQSEIHGSKLLLLSFDEPPKADVGQAYKRVELVPASFNYSRWMMLKRIGRELSRMQERFAKGQLSRAHLLSGNLSLCRGLNSASLELTLNLNRQIADLEVPLKISRMPAGFR